MVYKRKGKSEMEEKGLKSLIDVVYSCLALVWNPRMVSI
jgi:hypothetical protein